MYGGFHHRETEGGGVELAATKGARKLTSHGVLMEVVANIGGARESGSCRPSRGLVRRRRLGRRLVLGLRGSTVTPLGRCNGLTTGSEQPKNSTPPPRCEEHSTITVSCLPTENSHKYMIYIYIYHIYICVCNPPHRYVYTPFPGPFTAWRGSDGDPPEKPT